MFELDSPGGLWNSPEDSPEDYGAPQGISQRIMELPRGFPRGLWSSPEDSPEDYGTPQGISQMIWYFSEDSPEDFGTPQRIPRGFPRGFWSSPEDFGTLQRIWNSQRILPVLIHDFKDVEISREFSPLLQLNTY